MKTTLLLLAAALCGQAQEKIGTGDPLRREDGTLCQPNDWIIGYHTCAPAPPSLESRVEKLETKLQWLDAVIEDTAARLNRKMAEVADMVRQYAPYHHKAMVSWPPPSSNWDITPPSSIVAFYDPVERGVRVMTREEANALLVALANAINKASAQRAAEEWSREPKK